MDITFLILSLFIPRITLIVYYFFLVIPPNPVPFIGDVLLAVFLPRPLILIYIAYNLGTSSPWFWIHLVVAIIVYITSWKNKHRVRRRER